MSTVPAAKQAASRYITTDVAGTVETLTYVGGTMTPNGRRLGYEVEFDRGTSVAGAIVGGLLLGLVAALLSLTVGIVLALIGFPPAMLLFLASLAIVAAAASGVRNGADASETERLTVTVDDAGDVVMANRGLSSGEFSRAIDRQYDRETDEIDHVVGAVSKHWLFHKAADRYLDSKRND